MKRLALIFLCCVGFINVASAQNCPTPYYAGDQRHSELYIDLPVPEGWLPNGNQNHYSVYVFNSMADGFGGVIPQFSGVALPNSSNTSSFWGVIPYGQTAVAHIYLTEVSYNSQSSRFTKNIGYVINRFRRSTGEDMLAIGRFGSSTRTDNFLMVMPLVYDANGNFDLSVTTTCTLTSTVQAFNSRFLNVGVRKPSIGVYYQGEYLAADFHNSLYPNKLCTGVLCPRVMPCPDC